MNMKDYIEAVDLFGKKHQDALEESFLDDVKGWMKDTLGLDDDEAEEIAQGAEKAAKDVGAVDDDGEVQGKRSDRKTRRDAIRSQGAEPAAEPTVAGRPDVPVGSLPGSAGAGPAPGTGDSAAEPTAEPAAEPTATGGVRQTGGDGPEEIDPDDEKADIAAVKALQAKQAKQAAANGADNTPAAKGGSLLGRKLDLTTPNLMTAYREGGNKPMPAISNLQRALVRVGEKPGPIDGKYGRSTYNAVQQFQKKNKLSVDGQAGPDTMAALKKAIDDRFAKNKVDPSQTAAPKAAATAEPTAEPKAAATAEPTAEPTTKAAPATPDYSSMTDDEARSTIANASPDLITQLSKEEQAILAQLRKQSAKPSTLSRDF